MVKTKIAKKSTDAGPSNGMNSYDPKLARAFVLDELFDLTLYRAVRTFSKGDVSPILDQLIPIEEGHVDFWKDFFKLNIDSLNLGRKIKLRILVLFCRIFGTRGIHLILEAIEVYGIKKYLDVWEFYKNDPLGEAVREVLNDEFLHEDEIVSSAVKQKIRPGRVRDIFLGLNDGLVEILGAVSGFFAAFQAVSSVLIASSTVAVAGAISMAAGAYVAMGSETEMKKTMAQKKKFLGEEGDNENFIHPFNSAIVVGVSYFIGALVPVLPVFFGAQNLFASVIAAGVAITVISYILAFLSGMDVKRRILINLIIMAIAVSITYTIGTVATNIWGVAI